MKSWIALACACVLAACASSPPAAPTPPQAPAQNFAVFDWFEYSGRDPVFENTPSGEYQNPILAGFYPDPSVTRVGEDYYLVNSTFAFFPGIPVWHSRDLVNWTQIGNAIDRPGQLSFDGLGSISRGVFAPAIAHHGDLFYIINTCIDCGGNFVVTARDPAGPWSDPIWLPFDGIDPSLFFDEDGKAYVVHNGPPVGTPRYNGHTAIWLQEFDPQANKMVGDGAVIVDAGTHPERNPIWIEGPHLLKFHGYYYLIAAEGGTEAQHSEVVFRSRHVRGPYVAYSGNPILTQRQLDPARPNPISATGHADFVETQNGDWLAVFLGTRPYAYDSSGPSRDTFLFNTGRETFMAPVRWSHGWPVVTSDDDVLPYAHARPNLPASAPAGSPTTGNFTQRYEFDDPKLGFEWLFVRTPREPWYALHDGVLSLRARNQSIGGFGQPSFVAHRQQHTNASASTEVRFTAVNPNGIAGLAAYQNDDFYFVLGVGQAEGRRAVLLKRRAGHNEDANGVLVASAPLAGDGPVYLRIDARGGRYDFSFSETQGQWTPLARDVDGSILSTRVAGGFVGAMLGMYAYDDVR
ncbi:MAG TPA: glycoside hydrolase family 43 protein [Caulobacterales bacterium]|nr:glycoside hydrolase family 43 protein [Caulobacterales bacterium]